MNIDANILNKLLQTKFSSVLKPLASRIHLRNARVFRRKIIRRYMHQIYKTKKK